MSKDELYKTWETRIADFRASGQTARAWCTKLDLNLHTLRYWLRKFPQPSSCESTESIRWLSVELDQASANDSSLLTVQIGTARIEVRPGFNPVLLKQVVNALQHAE